MYQDALSLSGLVLICLCADFFSEEVKPLSSRQYQQLEFKLAHSTLRYPSGLLNYDSQEMIIQLALNEEDVQRIQKRLQLLSKILKVLAYYEARGIHVITKFEDGYPKAFAHRLKKEAPLMLFYSGDLALLQEPMISIAGPVHTNQTMQENTISVVHKIQQEGYHLMTSGHAGCEQIGMLEYLKNNGKVILFAANDLLKRGIEFKKMISSGQMLLLSHRVPEADYDVVESLVRNSYIYALCHTNFIIHSELNTGALYFSAIQNLKHRWSKLLAIVDDEFYGNAKLVEAGAIPVTMEKILSECSIDELMEVSKHQFSDLSDTQQLSIFEFIEDEVK